MILKASEIAAILESTSGANDDPLAIVPTPKIDNLKTSGAASIDLRLGRWFRTLRQSRHPLLALSDETNVGEGEGQVSKEHFEKFGGSFILHPGKFVLGVTLEWLRIPSHMAAYITGKSSWGRRGLIIETAPGVHPGFSGCLALEITNVGEVPIQLTPGMEICQIFLHQVSQSQGQSQGRYFGRRKPVLGKIESDDILDKLKRP
jgi:dCTP deaminase